MSKVGVYRTPSGNVPAIIDEYENGKFNILALGNANAQRRADQVDVSFADGAATKTLYVDNVNGFESPAAEELGVTVVGDAITIPDNVIVVPVGLVDLGSAYIVLDGGTIMGREAVGDGFMSTTTGGVVRHNGGSLSSNEYFIIAPNGPGFVGVGSKANGDILKLRMVGVFSSPLGFDFTGYDVPSIESCFIGQIDGMPAPAKGVAFDGTIGKIHIQNTPFFDVTDACIEFAATMSADEMDIAGNYYETLGGVKFMRGVPGYVLNNIAEVVRNVPRGAITAPDNRLEGIGLFDTKWNYISNPGFPDSRAIGIDYQDDVGFETTTITEIGTRVKANLSTTASVRNQRFETDPDGTLHYVGVRPWTVLVTITGRCDTQTNGQEIEFTIAKDGDILPESKFITRINTGGDQRNFTVSALVYVEPEAWHTPVVQDCTLELYVANLTSTADVDIADCVIRATS